MDLRQIIWERMEFIDLGLREVALSGRGMLAAIKFVQQEIIDIRGDTKEDFHEKPWFAFIFHTITEWYRDKYGPAFEQNGGFVVLGVVLVRDIPVELNVPLSTTTVEIPGETAWVHFPGKVADDEQPENWLVKSPPLDKLHELENERFRTDLLTVCNNLRTICIGLMGVVGTRSEVRDLAAGIKPDLQSSASNILRNDDAARAVALWSLQMAIEKAYKALACQKNGSFRETHDLFRLHDDVSDHVQPVNRNLLKRLPNSREAIDLRYGIGHKPNLGYAVGAYVAALELIGTLVPCFERRFGIMNGSILVKRPPWTNWPPER